MLLSRIIDHNKFASRPRKRIATQTFNKRGSNSYTGDEMLLSHDRQQSYSNSRGLPEFHHSLSLNLCKVTWLIQSQQLHVKKNSYMGCEAASWRSWWTVTTGKKTSVKGNLGSHLKKPLLTWCFLRSNVNTTPFALGLLKSNFKKHFFFFFAMMIICPAL